MGRLRMSEREENKKDQRDALDGGFAVVDRERLIDEETRKVAPWYKHFIHVFISPVKMMEECFNQDPPKGTSVGVVGVIVFTVICLGLTFINPQYKQILLNQLRSQGIGEVALDQSYQLGIITGLIGGLIGVFIGCLIGAIVLFIIKIIARDKGRFGTIYKVMLLASMVGLAVQSLDALFALVIGQYGTIFGISILLSQEQLQQPVFSVVASVVSLQSIAQILIMIIGYKVMTQMSYQKAVLRIGIYELLTVGSQIGLATLLTSFTQGLITG